MSILRARTTMPTQVELIAACKLADVALLTTLDHWRFYRTRDRKNPARRKATEQTIRQICSAVRVVRYLQIRTADGRLSLYER